MSDIDWSAQQLEALASTTNWFLKGTEPYYILAGYAGTGKTTIARELGRRLGTGVLFAAFTGKAAHVLMKAGVPHAHTIHSLIYQPRDKCDKKFIALKKALAALRKEDPISEEKIRELEELIRKEQANLQRPDFTLNTDSAVKNARLVVIDEYSMVDEQMGKDLLSFGCRILALGDPGQLPPVQSKCFFTEQPHMLLTEIHRHSEGNPIIKLSKDVREGLALKPGTYGKSRMMYRSSLKPDEEAQILLGADQVLCGKNVTRRKLNKTIRDKLGYVSPLPQPGDKLVCLRNNHDEGFLNGQTWHVVTSKEYGKGKHYLSLGLQDDDGNKRGCVAHRAYFDGDPENVDRSNRAVNEFDFGYVLTVHKSQGSQWGSVVLIDEWTFSDREKWLYTGITRAVESVTVLR